MAVDAKKYIEFIASRLWNHKAAIIVGAGFSKNASEDYPDWKQLADVIWQSLKKETKNSKGNDNRNYVDVMRLAEEYESTLGRPALDDIISKACDLKGVKYSKLHARLLKLPWTDVFTTNYDNLLECARQDVTNIKYDLVNNKYDLANAKRPRIIKLHGSLPSERPFVLSARDYRNYPFDNAPFVNTVQQALLENTICLIGFSGDDPNFLNWVEWVKRNLGEKNVQKIFLFSLDGYNDSREKMLHDNGIVTIRGSCKTPRKSPRQPAGDVRRGDFRAILRFGASRCRLAAC